jgi:hypothetical protein
MEAVEEVEEVDEEEAEAVDAVVVECRAVPRSSSNLIVTKAFSLPVARRMPW